MADEHTEQLRMRVFGKYEMLEELSATPGARAFRTRDRILQRETLVKAFPVEGFSPAGKRRFWRELEAAAKLNHPSLVCIYEYGERDGFIYVAMECIEGESIRQFIDRQGEMTLEAKIEFMTEVCDGLSWAHENGVFHGNLGAENILRLKSGRAKILDCAFAAALYSKAFSPAGPSATQSGDSRTGRTPARKGAADLFAMADVYFELLTYERPFGGNLINEKNSGDPSSIRDSNPAFPQRLEALIARALSQTPANRFRTASELASELRRVRSEVSSLSSTLAQELRALCDQIQTARAESESIDLDLPADWDLSDFDLEAKFGASLTDELDYFRIVDLRNRALLVLQRLRLDQPETAADDINGRPDVVPDAEKALFFAEESGEDTSAEPSTAPEAPPGPGQRFATRATISPACPGCGSTNPPSSVLCRSCSTRLPVQSASRLLSAISPSRVPGPGRAMPSRTQVSPKLLAAVLVVAMTVITASGGYLASRVSASATNRGQRGRQSYASYGGPVGDGAVGLAAAGVFNAANRSNGSMIRSLGLKVGRIAIDPGHGGPDTGTVGPTGLTEKEFVLAVAGLVKDLIRTELDAEVIMTRDDDRPVSLERRTEIANENAVDLLISIHANSSPRVAVKGVETFFLSLPNQNAPEALEVASRENAASKGSIHDLDDLLKKITMHDKLGESRELAWRVQSALARGRGAGEDRGVKQAPFIVLVGAKMPAILAEIGFISNPDQERAMKTPQYRQQVAVALFEGIQSYLETLKTEEVSKTER